MSSGTVQDPSNKTAIVRLFHVSKRYGGKQALVDMTLDFQKNEFAFITGASGAGKTTLLKLLYLGESVSEGHVIIDGINLCRISRRQIPHLRRNFGIIFQDFKLIPTKTVFQNVALVLEAAGEKKTLIQKKVASVLRTAGMADKQTHYPPSLSGGEQQRVAVARAIVGEPGIILADEPTGSLDAASAEIIMDLLKGFHARGATLLIATHDHEMIRTIGGRVIQLEHGRLITDTRIEPAT